jgi:hypothetical protein
MAATITIELETGVSSGHLHSHNGYYAGDFPRLPILAPAAWSTPLAAFDSFERQPEEGVVPDLAPRGALSQCCHAGPADRRPWCPSLRA